MSGVTLRFQANLATRMLGVGRSKVWLDPNEKQRIAQARTRQEVRQLIQQGIIRKKVKTGQPTTLPYYVKWGKPKTNKYWKKQQQRADATNPSNYNANLPEAKIQQYHNSKSTNKRQQHELPMDYAKRIA
mmetsp:Transcript_21437/g.31854  ORF Transcript_21437/g.31854 Transcript_21437/m.31854 type:complete len:130 (+) Transcript_21437:154-543(+)